MLHPFSLPISWEQLYERRRAPDTGIPLWVGFTIAESEAAKFSLLKGTLVPLITYGIFQGFDGIDNRLYLTTSTQLRHCPPETHFNVLARMR